MQNVFLFNIPFNGPRVGVYAFQRAMFHGRARVTGDACKLYRNVFVEAPIITPFSIVGFRDDLFAEVKSLMAVDLFKTEDEFLFNMPYSLGKPSMDQGNLVAWPDKFIDDRSLLLHPSNSVSKYRYFAFDPLPIYKVDLRFLTDAEVGSPYCEIEEFQHGKIVRDQSFLNEIGIVRTGFGFQVSERLFESIKNRLLEPYFIFGRISLA